MANPEALAALRDRDLVGWHGWRQEHPGIVDLRGADLTGLFKSGGDFENLDLTGANLSKMYFAATSFRGSILENAGMGGMTLGRCDFEGANLRGAKLTESALFQCNFRGANLSNTTLVWATISGGNFQETDFSGAYLLATAFVAADLSPARGLTECRHNGPTSIGIDTLFASRGRIPPEFLRGAGVPEVFIEQSAALVSAVAPIQFHSCFISYSTRNQEFADVLYRDLRKERVPVWLATEDLKIGDPFRQRIDEAIHLQDKLLVVLSEHSVQSAWVQDEVEGALERERRENRLVLFPIRVDNAVMDTQQAWAAAVRRTRHIGDFTRWDEPDAYQAAFLRLLRDLQAESDRVSA